MGYFYVDVTTQISKTYLVEAENSWTADQLARKAAVENKSSENVRKIKEAVKTSLDVDRLPDDGDIYNSEGKHALTDL